MIGQDHGDRMLEGSTHDHKGNKNGKLQGILLTFGVFAISFGDSYGADCLGGNFAHPERRAADDWVCAGSWDECNSSACTVAPCGVVYRGVAHRGRDTLAEKAHSRWLWSSIAISVTVLGILALPPIFWQWLFIGSFAGKVPMRRIFIP